ncbi:translocator protein [Platysternon megacephalum]|uniref:Translocator protein n=1 Tax=Platysternon megacephalum TaxID=55544 RepID=A0A4D9E5R9_9SAUR|nr:translocator protein [Platysternon megacephalum]
MNLVQEQTVLSSMVTCSNLHSGRNREGNVQFFYLCQACCFEIFSINKNNFQCQSNISYLLSNVSVIYLNSQICHALLIKILSCFPQHNQYHQDSFVKKPGAISGCYSPVFCTQKLIQEKKHLLETGKYYLVKSFRNFNSSEENSNYGRIGA